MYPPGPDQPPLFLIWRWIRTPFELMEESQRRFGDAFTLHWPGIPDGLVAIADPAAIKAIFSLGPDEVHAGEANQVLKPFLGSQSLLLLDGADHIRHRKMIMPAFHGERMHAYGRTMIDLTDDAIDRLPIGKPFPIHSHTQQLTLQVIVRTVFGVEAGPRFSALADALTKTLDASAWPGLLFPIMQRDLGPLSPWGRWRRLHDHASKLIVAEIRRAREASTDTIAKRVDVLAMMLQAKDEKGAPLGEDEIHDELVTLLVAGHETTATSIAWALRWLLPNRKLLGELRDEVATTAGDPAKIGKLELLDDIVKETLRLQPVIPMVGRVLQQPMNILGWDLPKGALVAPAIHLVHRRPSIYPEPNEFHPRRFRTFKPAAWEFLPFGGGLRKCVGAAFAMYEMKMVLATIASRVEMHLARTDIKVARRSITLTPSHGLPVMVTRVSPRQRRQAA